MFLFTIRKRRERDVGVRMRSRELWLKPRLGTPFVPDPADTPTLFDGGGGGVTPMLQLVCASTDIACIVSTCEQARRADLWIAKAPIARHCSVRPACGTVCGVVLQSNADNAIYFV